MNPSIMNPWLSISLQTARLGWEAQHAMMTAFIRLAGGRGMGRLETAAVPEEIEPAETQPFAADLPAQGVPSRAATKKVMKVHKRTGGKRRAHK